MIISRLNPTYCLYFTSIPYEGKRKSCMNNPVKMIDSTTDVNSKNKGKFTRPCYYYCTVGENIIARFHQNAK